MALLNVLNMYPHYSWYAQQKCVYNFYSYDGSLEYIHMKTNHETSNGNYEMWMAEAIGYAYGSSQAIRCAWVWYIYPPQTPNEISHVGLQSTYPGMTPDGVYKSSDGYVVLRGKVIDNGFYFGGFLLNAYPTRAGQGHTFRILAAAQNNTSGSHY